MVWCVTQMAASASAIVQLMPQGTKIVRISFESRTGRENINSEETAIIKAALNRANIHPKRVRHYCGPVIITMDRPEKFEGEFLQIETLAWEALDAAPNASNLCSGIHVFSQFHGKLAAGYERFRRCKR
jgi:hypothetical protein